MNDSDERRVTNAELDAERTKAANIIEALQQCPDETISHDLRADIFAKLDAETAASGRVIWFRRLAVAAAVLLVAACVHYLTRPSIDANIKSGVTVATLPVISTPRQKACQWLSRTQNKDGSWSVARYGGKSGNETAVAALSLLAFLKEKDAFAAEIRQTAAHLIQTRHENGQLGASESFAMYNHGMALFALARARNVVTLPGLDEAIAKGVAYARQTQTVRGGWGYNGSPSATPNTVVTAWQVHALHAARQSGAEDAQSLLNRGIAYIRSAVREDNSIAYQGGTAGARPESLSAAGASCLLLSEDAATRTLGRDALAHLFAAGTRTFTLDDRADPYLAYFLSEALANSNGGDDRGLLMVVFQSLERKQVGIGADAGSFPSETTPWGHVGGRVYTTAMLAASLPDHM